MDKGKFLWGAIGVAIVGAILTIAGVYTSKAMLFVVGLIVIVLTMFVAIFTGMDMLPTKASKVEAKELMTVKPKYKSESNLREDLGKNLSKTLGEGADIKVKDDVVTPTVKVASAVKVNKDIAPKVMPKVEPLNNNFSEDDDIIEDIDDIDDIKVKEDISKSKVKPVVKPKVNIVDVESSDDGVKVSELIKPKKAKVVNTKVVKNNTKAKSVKKPKLHLNDFNEAVVVNNTNKVKRVKETEVVKVSKPAKNMKTVKPKASKAVEPKVKATKQATKNTTKKVSKNGLEVNVNERNAKAKVIEDTGVSSVLDLLDLK